MVFADLVDMRGRMMIKVMESHGYVFNILNTHKTEFCLIFCQLAEIGYVFSISYTFMQC